MPMERGGSNRKVTRGLHGMWKLGVGIFVLLGDPNCKLSKVLTFLYPGVRCGAHMACISPHYFSSAFRLA